MNADQPHPVENQTDSAANPWTARPIRDLHLTMAGTVLERCVARLEQELIDHKVTRLRPHIYLSTDWGVPFGTISIGVPFYLARPDLLAFHSERVGHIEGRDEESLMRYFRHEMGHVVNYAYKLYEREDWTKQFGAITQPYNEEYQAIPFNSDFVNHLPGWYAQKHPDEDWSETFAVWLSPQARWKDDYPTGTGARTKIEFCEWLMGELEWVDPDVTVEDADEAVSDLNYSVADFYQKIAFQELTLAGNLDGPLRALFDDFAEHALSDHRQLRKASSLIRQQEASLMENIFRWTSHFPESTRQLLRSLAARADALQQVYPEHREADAATALAVFVTSLAMNHVYRGDYFPKLQMRKS